MKENKNTCVVNVMKYTLQKLILRWKYYYSIDLKEDQTIRLINSISNN